MKFTDLGLSDTLVRTISDLGFSEATEIQAGVIPQVLMAQDVLGIAQTGTGKTAAFTLPMIDILSTGKAKSRMPRSLILEPTRELAEQVAEAFLHHSSHHNLKTATLIGGEHISAQIKQIEAGADVLIATPGRLLDLFERGNLILSDVKILVIDEADRMLDMGFIPDVKKIVAMLSKMKQTLFFTATLSDDMKTLAKQFLRNPKEIIVSSPSSTASTIKQYIITTKAGKSKNETVAAQKRKLLIQLLTNKEINNAIIFCNQKRSISATLNAVTKAGFKAVALHGDLSQTERKEALEAFKSGQCQFMICSDVAARGIDVQALSHVINLDVPTKAEDYVHRIGRTGRAKQKGQAWMIATKEDEKYLKSILALGDMAITLGHVKEHQNVNIGINFSEEKEEEVQATTPSKEEKPKKPNKEQPKSKKEQPKKKHEQQKTHKPEIEKEVVVKSDDEENLLQKRRVRKQASTAKQSEQQERLPKKRTRRRSDDEVVQIAAEPEPEQKQPQQQVQKQPKPKPEVEDSLLKVEFKTIARPSVRKTAQGRTIGMGEHVPEFMLTEVMIKSSAFLNDKKKHDN